MNSNILRGAMVLLSGSLLAADSSPKDDITSAAGKLAEKSNYSWKTTVVVPESARFRPGPTEGKTEKDGFTHITMSFANNTTQAVLKGDKAAVTNPEGAWQSLAELDNGEGPGRFLGTMLRNFKTPAAQAGELASAAKELKKDGDAYSGDLTEEGAKAQFRFGTRRPDRRGREGAIPVWDRQQSQRFREVLGERWRALEVRIQSPGQGGLQRQRSGRGPHDNRGDQRCRHDEGGCAGSGKEEAIVNPATLGGGTLFGPARSLSCALKAGAYFSVTFRIAVRVSRRRR